MHTQHRSSFFQPAVNVRFIQLNLMQSNFMHGEKQQVSCGAAVVWCILLWKPRLGVWLTFARRREQSRSQICDSLCRQREEDENWRGRVSTPPASDLLLGAVQFALYLQHRGGKRLEGEESRGYKKKKDWNVKHVLVLSMHTASSSSVHERRGDKEIARKAERTWI